MKVSQMFPVLELTGFIKSFLSTVHIFILPYVTFARFCGMYVYLKKIGHGANLS